MRKITTSDFIQVASKLGYASKDIGGKLIACICTKHRTLFYVDGERISRADVEDWMETYRRVRRVK